MVWYVNRVILYNPKQNSLRGISKYVRTILINQQLPGHPQLYGHSCMSMSPISSVSIFYIHLYLHIYIISIYIHYYMYIHLHPHLHPHLLFIDAAITSISEYLTFRFSSFLFRYFSSSLIHFSLGHSLFWDFHFLIVALITSVCLPSPALLSLS